MGIERGFMHPRPALTHWTTHLPPIMYFLLYFIFECVGVGVLWLLYSIYKSIYKVSFYLLLDYKDYIS